MIKPLPLLTPEAYVGTLLFGITIFLNVPFWYMNEPVAVLPLTVVPTIRLALLIPLRVVCNVLSG